MPVFFSNWDIFEEISYTYFCSVIIGYFLTFQLMCSIEYNTHRLLILHCFGLYFQQCDIPQSIQCLASKPQRLHTIELPPIPELRRRSLPTYPTQIPPPNPTAIILHLNPHLPITLQTHTNFGRPRIYGILNQFFDTGAQIYDDLTRADLFGD